MTEEATEKETSRAGSMETALCTCSYRVWLEACFVRFMWNPWSTIASPSWREAEVLQHNGPAVTLGSHAWVRSAVLFLLFESSSLWCEKAPRETAWLSQATERPSGIFAGHQWELWFTSCSHAELEEGRTGRESEREEEIFPSQATKLGDPSFIVLGLQWSTVARSLWGQSVSLWVWPWGKSNEWGRKTDKWEVVAWCWVWLRV